MELIAGFGRPTVSKSSKLIRTRILPTGTKLEEYESSGSVPNPAVTRSLHHLQKSSLRNALSEITIALTLHYRGNLSLEELRQCYIKHQSSIWTIYLLPEFYYSPDATAESKQFAIAESNRQKQRFPRCKFWQKALKVLPPYQNVVLGKNHEAYGMRIVPSKSGGKQ
ncbi:MAG: hypothetical protein SFX74_07470 [Fimbriimonadaceae bacterium]|nr:hypothetical protein [Fimbriimonadaceae bacterium]